MLTLCALSILTAFLIESDQEVLRFLDSIQICILWTMLTGVFVAIGALMLDLGEPFRGSFRVDSSTYQLVVMRAELAALVQALAREPQPAVVPAGVTPAIAAAAEPAPDERRAWGALADGADGAVPPPSRAGGVKR